MRGGLVICVPLLCSWEMTKKSPEGVLCVLLHH